MIKLLSILYEIKIDTSQDMDNMNSEKLSKLSRGDTVTRKSSGDRSAVWEVLSNNPRGRLITLRRISPLKGESFTTSYGHLVDD